jgi:hypothetical protein
MPVTPIMTAAARYEGGIPVAVDLGTRNGGVVEFHFSVGIGVRMLRTIERIEEARRDDNTGRVELVRALVDYLLETVDPAEKEVFANLIEQDVLDVNTLAAIFTFVREASAETDPTQQPSSEPASPQTGLSSAAGAPPEASTQAPSPTTG